MHPRIAELVKYLDAQTANLQAAFESTPLEGRAVRPAPGRWSPAEVVHHVVIIERGLVQQLRTLIEQARALPPETESTSLFPMQTATRIELRSFRVTTPEAAEPRDTDPDRVWRDYLETREALKYVIATGDGLALGAVTSPHPMLGDFTAYEWIAYAGAHAARHADQIREMTVSLR
jgi:hypothetical protein